jgi:hypothetical protein
MSRTFFHKHHIIPKHAGGTDDPSNLIYLTVEEHAEAHKLLFEQCGRWQDKLAWKALSGVIGKEEIIKERQRMTHLGKPKSSESIRKTVETRKLNGSYTPSKETTEKRAAKLRGVSRKPFSDEWKHNISKSKKGLFTGNNHHMFGKSHSKEAIEKNRLAHLGHMYNRGRVFSKISCEKCGSLVATNRLNFHQSSIKCYEVSIAKDS